MHSREDNPTERRSFNDALYKHLYQHRFRVCVFALDFQPKTWLIEKITTQNDYDNK